MSTGAGTPGGGVRSLRAMFENHNQDSPADTRGRSPSARSNGDISRPLSRVRSSFIPVETTKKTRNDTPDMGDNGSRHRESFSAAGDQGIDVDALSELKRTATQELALRRSNGSIPESSAEDPVHDPASIEKELPTSVGAITIPSVTSTSVSRATSESRPDIQALEASSPITKPAKESPQACSPEVPQPSALVLQNLAESLRTPKPARSTSPEKNTIAPLPIPTPEKVDVEATSTSETIMKKKSSNGEKALEKSIANAPSTQRTQNTRGKSRASSGTITTGGFMKPKPRSPTRPVRLPVHLVAPTASSAAKQGISHPTPPPRTLSRRSSNVSTASRRPSVRNLNAPPVPRINHDRVNAEPRSPSTVPASSFLERMMRPTASSASKVKEKPVKPTHHSRS